MRICFQMTKVLLLGMIRDRRSVILLFLMPLVTTTILSFALGPEFRGGSIPRFTVAVYNADQGALGNKLVDTLRSLKGSIDVLPEGSFAAASRAVVQKKAAVEVIIPNDYSAKASRGKAVSITVKAPLDKGTQSAIVQDVVNQFGRVAGEDYYAAKNGLMAPSNRDYPQVQVSIQSTGMHAMTAGSYYAVGMMVLFLMSTALGRAYVVLYERKSDMFKRLMAAPVKRGVLTAGYVISNFVTLAVQGAVNLICDVWILHVYLGPWWEIGIVLCVYAVALSGFAVFLGSFVNQDGIMNGISSIGGNAASILGGSVYPMYAFPSVMQWIAKILPNGQAMNAFLNTITGISLMGLGTSIAYLLGFGLVASLVARLAQWRPAES